MLPIGFARIGFMTYRRRKGAAIAFYKAHSRTERPRAGNKTPPRGCQMQRNLRRLRSLPRYATLRKCWHIQDGLHITARVLFSCALTLLAALATIEALRDSWGWLRRPAISLHSD
jgi:hypothetical protein